MRPQACDSGTYRGKATAKRRITDFLCLCRRFHAVAFPFSLFSFSVTGPSFSINRPRLKKEKRKGQVLEFTFSCHPATINLCTLGGMKRKWRFAHSRTCCKFLQEMAGARSSFFWPPFPFSFFFSSNRPIIKTQRQGTHGPVREKNQKKIKELTLQLVRTL